MDKFSLVLLALFMVALALMGVPGVWAMNRGKMLRNIALWLAIVVGLALIYRHFGPNPPAGLSSESGQETEQEPTPATGDEGYTPPGE